MGNSLQNAQTILKALEFAAERHRDQRRKNVEASPYIIHPIQVAEVLATVGEIDDPTTLIAAILHDTVEDSDATQSNLEQLFGREVAEAVAEVTDDKSLPRQERKRLQVQHSPQLSDRAKLIKIADKACNVRDLGRMPPMDWDENRRQEYIDWAAAVVAGCRGVNQRLEEYFDACLAESASRLARDRRE